MDQQHPYFDASKTKMGEADVNSNDTSSIAPPPSYKSTPSIQEPTFTVTPPNTTTLKIKYHDALARHGQVLDAVTGEAIYASEHRYRSPAFTLNTASDPPATIATANSSKWSMKMDFSISGTGHEFPVDSRRKLSSDMVYVSPAFGGQTMTWEHQRNWGKIEYVLLDEQAQPIARFKGGSSWKCMPWGTFGEMDLVSEKVVTAEQRDEVVAVGLGLSYKAVMQRQTAVTTVVVSS